MFEGLDVLAERLLAATPAQDNRDAPVLDPDGSLLEQVVRLERVKAAADAEQMLIYAALCQRAETWQDAYDPDRDGQVGPDDLVAAELAPALHLAPVTAAIRVARAVGVVTRLPGTLAAYRRGDLDLGRVLAIDEATCVLSDPDAARVEELVLPAATDQTAGELRAALRRAVIAVDPAAAEKRRKQAIKVRSVTRYQDKDGTSVLRAVLSAIDTMEIYDLIDQMARRTKTSEDTRSIDARRADMFVWALLGREPHLGPEGDEDDPPPTDPPPANNPDDPGPDDPGPDQPDEPVDDWNGADLGGAFAADADDPDPGLADPEPVEPADRDDLETAPPDPAQAVVNAAWRNRELTRFDKISELAALALSAMTSRRPPALPWVAVNTCTGTDGRVVQVGELQGYGPITSQYAEHLMWTGAARPPDLPSGREPTAAQARAHDPPGWLDREVRARDGTCRFPGCKQSAHLGDLDHTIPFPRGLTVRTNLGDLCRRHHRVKGSGCWRIVQHDDGIYEWTSTISGRAYTTYPRGTTGEWRGTTNHRQ